MTMELRQERDAALRASRVILEVRDETFYQSISLESLLTEIQSRLAVAVVDMLMARIGPAVEAALRSTDETP